MTDTPLRRPPGRPRKETDDALEKRLAESHDWAAEAAAEIAGKYPWHTANVRIKIGYQLRLPEPTHVKLKYIVEREPNLSMHSLILECVEAEIARRLVKHTEK
jgi:hypothetical protein